MLLCGLEAALGVGELAVLCEGLREFAEPLDSLLLLQSGFQQGKHPHGFFAEMQVQVKNSRSLEVLLPLQQLAQTIRHLQPHIDSYIMVEHE